VYALGRSLFNPHISMYRSLFGDFDFMEMFLGCGSLIAAASVFCAVIDPCCAAAIG
jgi:hypothetical protein